MLALTVGRAQAFDLVPGGYGAPSLAATDNGSAVEGALAFSSAPQDLSLDYFTPRQTTITLWEGETGGKAERPGPRFDLTLDAGRGTAMDRLGLDLPAATARRPQQAPGGGLAVGGAMRWADWSLGGAYAHTDLLGAGMDLMTASVGYGRVSAELSLGQAVDAEETPLDVLMFSTDLAAWSWLTLESDVAVGSDREREEAVTVGRVGIRLNF
jgi:hypothetical protein